MILVTGFGPFMDVKTNPSGELARACHGLRVRGETLYGLVLPVAYVEGIQQTLAAIEAHGPRLVLGMGVSRQAAHPRLEAFGYRDYSTTLPDADGRIGQPPAGPKRVASTLDVPRLCHELGVEHSTDPGRYVCNAWLYEVAIRATCPVGFLHVPMTGFDLSRLLAGLDRYLLTSRDLEGADA